MRKHIIKSVENGCVLPFLNKVIGRLDLDGVLQLAMRNPYIA